MDFLNPPRETLQTSTPQTSASQFGHGRPRLICSRIVLRPGLPLTSNSGNCGEDGNDPEGIAHRWVDVGGAKRPQYLGHHHVAPSESEARWRYAAREITGWLEAVGIWHASVRVCPPILERELDP